MFSFEMQVKRAIAPVLLVTIGIRTVIDLLDIVCTPPDVFLPAVGVLDAHSALAPFVFTFSVWPTARLQETPCRQLPKQSVVSLGLSLVEVG